ncbi:MAG: signal peptide peptidase [Bacteroidetes bacterium]|nr:signal peptide peptidase [Bacteroidota bacterium]
MKQFLKFTLATIVGIIITSLLSSLLFFGLIGAIASSTEKTVKVQSNSVYELDLEGQLVERSEDDPFSGVFADAVGKYEVKNIGLDDVLANISKAKDDVNIKGIYLKGGTLSGGYASVKEIRDALADFKKSGKFIVSYADMYSQRMYYLCSVADKVYINPQGMIEFQGIAANTMFLKNTLDKLGVDAQVVKVGTFKSAVEPYLNTKMSDANKVQVNTFISSIWNNLISEISVSRKISKDSLNRYADDMMTFQPTEKLLKNKMVDSLTYIDGMDVVLKKMLKVDNDDDVQTVSHSEYCKVPSLEKMQKDKIAVIYAAGGIDMDKNEGIVSKDLVETIRKVMKAKSVKAVVFRVNSGGGSAYGSEQIWHALAELKAQKPLIVSMGDYAASGGYYISCMADSIVAQPNTLTGSIGIFGVIPNIKGLNDKLGITYDGVKTNKMSDAISLNRAFTPEERNMMQNYVNRGYEIFVKRCADGRKKTPDQIKAIAEGRVWTGEDAKKIGLVDKIGGLNDAIVMAVKKAKLTEYQIKTYPEKEDFMTRLMKDFNTTIETRIMKGQLGEKYEVLKQIQQIEKYNGIQAVMPFQISMN